MSEPHGQYTIRTSGGPDELLRLLDWFRHDDALRGRIGPPPARIRDGQMGDIYDVLVMAVGAGGLAPALTRSLTAWLTHRRSDITVTVQRPDGAAVTFDAKRIKTPEVLRELGNLLDGPDSSQ